MKKVFDVLNEAIQAKAFPGAAAAWGDDRSAKTLCLGRTRYDVQAPEVDAETLWDLASVTKVVSTTTTALILHSQGLMDLEAGAAAYAPRFGHPDVTIRDLLLHRSGLPAYASFQASCRTPKECEDALFALSLRPGPAKTEYSCMGFMTLQKVIESIVGEGLDRAARRLVFEPLGMSKTFYLPALEDRRRCAPTEEIPGWRREIEDERGYERVQETWIQGGVHDPAAFMIGGVSGNAGLFSTLADMIRWSQHLAQGGGSVVDPHILGLWRRRFDDDSTRALGFDTKSPSGSSAGSLFGARSFGHTGYTGTSVWIDPDTARWCVLLTARVHPRDGDSPMTRIRGEFADAVWQELSGSA
jgi:CubicO group peptidase (beta-lactamase class C family)